MFGSTMSPTSWAIRWVPAPAQQVSGSCGGGNARRGKQPSRQRFDDHAYAGICFAKRPATAFRPTFNDIRPGEIAAQWPLAAALRHVLAEQSPRRFASVPAHASGAARPARADGFGPGSGKRSAPLLGKKWISALRRRRETDNGDRPLFRTSCQRSRGTRLLAGTAGAYLRHKPLGRHTQGGNIPGETYDRPHDA